MDIDLAWTRAFVAVAEELHFGRAALRLGLSQPQVSRQIRSLEQALGVELFTRSPRATSLTDAGTLLLADARELLGACERLQDRAAQARRGVTGRVAVSFLWSTLGGFVAPLVAKAAERHPEIELSIAQAVFLDILPALRRGTADVVIARPTFAEHELVEETLASEPSLLAISERDPLAAREEFSVEELPGLPMVALERRLVPTAYDGAIDRSRAAGLEPWIVRHARSPTEALALVSAGVGVYRLPASAATPMPGVVYRELVGAPSRLTILHRPFPSAATQAIIELVWELYGDAPRASQNAGSALDQALASS